MGDSDDFLNQNPAEFFKRAAFKELSRRLSNLLGFATHPEPRVLGQDWVTQVNESTSEAVGNALDRCGSDLETAEKIRRAGSLARHFSALMMNRPALSTVPVEGWSVPRYRELFGDLSDLQREFARMGEWYQASDTQEHAVAASGQKPGAVVSLDPPQIVIDGNAYSLSMDAAEYLRELISCGDWMSDSEYKSRNHAVGENFRFDRLALPGSVRNRITTDRRKGKRWLG